MDLIGQLIANYQIIRKVGEGGMGAVYVAMHRELSRRAAIKVLHPELSRNAAILQRFFNEARAVNLVSHPGLVNIFEMGQLADGSGYLVMEFLEGETLAMRLSHLRGQVGQVVRIGRQIAAVLQAAHAKGIVHRDMKPENVMIVRDPEMPDGERVKVLDFGIAKVRSDLTGIQAGATSIGTLMGTPLYMAPEQCRGGSPIDGRADVYALGIMLYEMLTGRPPFCSDVAAMLMMMHMSDEPPPIASLLPDVPVELSALVMAMLRKRPEDRPAMQAVADTLRWMELVAAPLPLLPPRAPAPGRPLSVPASARTPTPPPVSNDVVRTEEVRGRSPLRAALVALSLVALGLLSMEAIDYQKRRVASTTGSAAMKGPAAPSACPAPPVPSSRPAVQLQVPSDVPACEPAPEGSAKKKHRPKKALAPRSAAAPGPSSKPNETFL